MVSPKRYFVVALLGGLATYAVLVGLPHDKHLRYLRLGGHFSKAGWIYERIHFDPKPTDVVFLGTSHTFNDVDDARVEDALAASYSGVTNVVNLGLPAHGRNLKYVIAKELLETRPVKLLVIEIREIESRVSHEFFPLLADSRDVVLPATWVDPFYFRDLLSMVKRQIPLFFQTHFPALVDLPPAYDPTRPKGSFGYFAREESISSDQMAEELRKGEEGKHWSLLGAPPT